VTSYSDYNQIEEGRIGGESGQGGRKRTGGVAKKKKKGGRKYEFAEILVVKATGRTRQLHRPEGKEFRLNDDFRGHWKL